MSLDEFEPIVDGKLDDFKLGTKLLTQQPFSFV